jgi:hypothetical protein
MLLSSYVRPHKIIVILIIFKIIIDIFFNDGLFLPCGGFTGGLRCPFERLAAFLMGKSLPLDWHSFLFGCAPLADGAQF